MGEAFIRTEDIDPKEVKNFFVETNNDREIINSLKSRQPIKWTHRKLAVFIVVYL